MIQSPKAYCDEIFFIRSGGIAFCESTSYHEPIIVFGKGSVINVYQVIMDDSLEFSLYAVCEESYQVSREADDFLIASSTITERPSEENSDEYAIYYQ